MRRQLRARRIEREAQRSKLLSGRPLQRRGGLPFLRRSTTRVSGSCTTSTSVCDTVPASVMRVCSSSRRASSRRASATRRRACNAASGASSLGASGAVARHSSAICVSAPRPVPSFSRCHSSYALVTADGSALVA